MARLVVGTGPSALRAAAVLAASGQQVLLLQEGATESGLRHPDLPPDTGLMHVRDDDRDATEAVLGALVEGPAPRRAVLGRGHLLPLPLWPNHVARLLPPTAHYPAVRDWARARWRAALSQAIGGGQEERSYRDWVVRRMGRPAWHHLYRPYARGRWGVDPDSLAPTVARRAHGLADPGPFQVVGGDPAQALDHAAQVIRAAGGEIRTGVQVAGLQVAQGRVVAVRLAGGEALPVDERLWVTASPSRVLGWLGEDAPAAVDARALQALPVARVTLRGPTAHLPDQVHLLDEGALAWRVVSPYGLDQAAIFHVTAPRQAEDHELAHAVAQDASARGLQGFSAEGARVERLDEWLPVWRAGDHARLYRVLRAWQRLGLVSVGRAGAHAPLDAGEEIRLALSLRHDDDLPRAVRAVVSAPIRLDDLEARITRFVER